jgi:hypothetical protein
MSQRVFIVSAAMLLQAAGCSSDRPLDRKSARNLVHDLTVDSPWIRIPAGLPPSPVRDAKALRAYRQLVQGGILRCESDFAECTIGPKGKDLHSEGSAGIKVTIGLLVAGDVTVVRRIDTNAASATVTLRFRPSPVFTEFRSALIAILESNGNRLAEPFDGALAKAQFHRDGHKWHLEEVEPLSPPGAAFHATAAGAPQPSVEAVNVAPLATVQVSSGNEGSGHGGLRAIDGVVDGSSAETGSEWSTNAEREGAWIKLSWSPAVHIWEVILHGRSSAEDGIRSGTITFSDGNSIGVGELRRDGSGLRVPFGQRTVTWLQFQVNSAVGARTGLAEIEVLGAPHP